MEKLTLISFSLCPYVQRSVITLLEKGIDYDIEYVDLYDKPEWFLNISPFGKVPALKVGDQILFESTVITEYLDEIAEPRLHPQDPLQRAHHRAWIEFISAGLVDTYTLMVAKNEKEALAAVSSVREKLSRLEGQLTQSTYFAGGNFSLVDAAVAPMLQRLQWCENVNCLGIFERYPKVSAWRDHLLSRPSVNESVRQNIVEIFNEYLKGSRSVSFETEPSWLGTFIS